jgi:hypothetical protein
MLQQKNSAGRFTNPGHLMKHGNGIWERAGAKGRNSRVEALIGKGKSQARMDQVPVRVLFPGVKCWSAKVPSARGAGKDW